MRKQSKTRWVAVILVLAALVMIPVAGITQAQGTPAPPSAAPRLPEDTRTLPAGTGYRHPAADLRQMTVQSYPGPQTMLPDQVDYRTTPNFLGPVENQGNCGSCYAFGSGHGFEARMNYLTAPGTASDLSEEYSKECNWRELNNYTSGGYNWGSCDGGNYMMLASLWSQTGHMLESDTGYNASDTTCPSGHPFQQTLLDWLVISDWQTVANATTIQNYLLNYGPVTTSLDVGSSGDGGWGDEFRAYDGTYTLDHSGSTATDTNHCVLIVGYSNNLPPVSGSMSPASGWIVKNSWDTTWGDAGYFYITYGSGFIGSAASIMGDYQDYDTDGNIYFYDDDVGLEYGVGWSDAQDCGLVEVTPNENTYATRIETWVNAANTTLDVYLYDTFAGAGSNDPTSLLSSRLNQIYAEAGYHSVQIPPVALTTGDDVYAVVCYSSSYNYPLPCDLNGTVETGRTYTADGDGGPTGNWWFDSGLYAGPPDEPLPCNVAIRLRTSSQPTAVEVSGFGAGTSGLVFAFVVLGSVGLLAGGVFVARRRRK